MLKETIVKESLGLFRKYGIKSTSMDDISGHLKVSKKTLYQHFKDKESLLLFAIDRITREFEEKLRSFQQSKENPVIIAAKIFEFILIEIARYSSPYFYDLRKIPAANKRLNDFQDRIASVYILPLLNEAQEKGIIRSDADIKLVYGLHFYHLEEIMTGIRPVYMHANSRDLFRHMILFNLRGLLTDANRKLLDPLLSDDEKK